jgi:hypothetical protein
MGFLSRCREAAEDLDAMETHPAVTGRSRRRRLVTVGAAAAVLAAGGAVIATATPAQANVANAVVREDIINVPSFGIGDGAAVCVGNEKVISGGALIMSMDPRVRVSSSFANADFRWFVRIANPTNDFQEVHIRALCATNISGYSQRTGPISLPPHSSQNLGHANCPSGSVAIGGGFIAAVTDFDRPNVKVSESWPDPANPTQWNVGMRNDSNGFYGGTAQVICTTQTNRSRPTGKTSMVSPESSLVVFEECTAVQGLVVAGGYREVGDFPTAIVTGFLPSSDPPPYWKYNFSNPDPSFHQITTFHACLPT